MVVPARDEEANLPRLLASVRRQQPGPAEVVVVDDHSSDATAAVALEGGATVVSPDPLPPGWTGKSWACWTGARSTRSPTLVFLDADTELAPRGLARVLAEHRRRGGLLSVQPFHRVERPYEAMSAFFNLVSMMGVDAFTPVRRRPAPIGAFGPCLVCSRADYITAGGHEAVAGEIVEDVALARRFVEAGLPVACLGGRDTIAFRMYPEGLHQLVEGWTKNFAAGARSTRPATFLLVTAWLSGCITAASGLGVALLRAGRTRGSRVGPAAGRYLAFALQLRWMLRRVGTFGWWPAVVYPAPLACFLAVFARSVGLASRGRAVPWKGRMVPTRSGQAAGTGRAGRRTGLTSSVGS